MKERLPSMGDSEAKAGWPKSECLRVVRRPVWDRKGVTGSGREATPHLGGNA